MPLLARRRRGAERNGLFAAEKSGVEHKCLRLPKPGKPKAAPAPAAAEAGTAPAAEAGAEAKKEEAPAT